MKEKLSVGVIGLGQRGFFCGTMYPGLIHNLAKMDDVTLVSVCDEYPDRVETTIKSMKETYDIDLEGTTDYMEIINNPKIDTVMIFCSWEMHVPIAIAAMKAHKAVALEVGGAYSVEDCYRLVRTQEETGAHFMLLENCCYDRTELMVLNMVKQGLFGEIVHCHGGYCHDLRIEISQGEQNRHYRLRNYLGRNCDNYPTHELGPIAKVLNINHGNRMVSLSSFSSKSAGLNVYNERLYGNDHKLAKADFMQGDVVTTVIKCAGGETITLTLDTTLPRPYYNREFTVRGTKGCYLGETNTLLVEEKCSETEETNVKPGNANEFYEKYDNPIWEEYFRLGIDAGHGGIDYHVLRAFVESTKEGFWPPIDVYDAAAWMCISALSEKSIALGGALVEIPDFTGGRWIKTKPKKEWKYSL